MAKESVGIALSGGVDSTVAACLLLEDGWDVTGFFMELAQPDLEHQRRRVTEIAARLGIELRRIDLRDDFHKSVIAYLREQYRLGLTPNPCVVCNREIKFGLLRRAMAAVGIKRMATGHYARIRRDNGLSLLKGVDGRKDQSYFLAALDPAQLDGLALPLGEYLKKDVFAMALARGFSGFSGESQDVCFLADGAVGDFLADQLGENDGPIMTKEGRELGRHHGLFRYTVGQRRGLGLPDATPWYVVRLDWKKNAVIVGKNDELFCAGLTTSPARWLRRPADFSGLFTTRIRSGHAGCLASIVADAADCLTIKFTESQRAVAPGQFAVIYHDDEVLGSAVIDAPLPC
ncbi:MAG: tRNA 2-thiouridine(34) synthase MnmA [Desulfobulbaceae bacterium]|nr:tRNA 2-thiouridine(34) synthase MnmA [Desulfobulbaceae bacterium]